MMHFLVTPGRLCGLWKPEASSKDVVRQLCQESFCSMAPSSERLLAVTCSGLSVTREEAAQVLQALHHLTRLVVFRGLSSAEAVLALFPENFHQNLKNLLTKIILEHISTWRTDAQASQNPRRPQAMRGQTLRLGCHHGAEQRNAGHHARRLGPHPRPAFCRGQ
ncbi:COMM domain-containing protein 9 isoform X4 [Tupaia chinensis]|uniref:COMM domain-containing protein 9 isoform X4 n=1 Tax=Tupaia chinensis TaxID=246437 RepID=UPI000703FFA3|nr:COMM domain-containing protein 9 isoform X4 [Tupaia chinensis]